MLIKNSEKYLDFETCLETLAEIREAGSKVVLCHGTFDLLHPGHLAHLQEAKELGNVLVVSITAAPYVNRGPGRPIFSDDLRLYALASLSCVDYVLLAPVPTALEVLDRVQPDIYCKGHEYADASEDVTQNIQREIDRVRSYGGDIRYTGEIVFSSTKLSNNYLNALPPQIKNYADEFVDRYSFKQVREAVDAMQKLKVLVLGDVIIDEFNHCSVQGLTSKGRVISTRFLRKEQHLGGSLAIARHVANFAESVTIAGVVGKEPDIHSLILNNLDGKMRLDLLYEEDYPTVIKRRYIERQGMREDYNKLFSINELREEGLAPQERQKLVDRLESTLGSYDLVIVADYGHGLIDESVIDVLQTQAPFLAINCQTNSANHGYNLITKYKRADSFCLDEQELRLAFSSRYGDHRHLLQRLHQHLSADQGWLTLGSSGSLAINRKGDEEIAPALTLQVKDTTGAGDAFLALASMSAKLELPLAIGSLLGNLAGAIAANILGNAHPVEKSKLLKFATTILKV
ncbi:adenylyltransferase/cytidyltransferase family protein [Lusitaniella coriacea LEGE 07157]|uniref:Adenylyltransferase/cytidyltransferase family protein n=1 Tax=Lusitaniella coriacea LEGE 07157 TaxID=945747 RepID=A0A8J7ITI9_9CYAN|nr:PfkB family carbohydrate kinase [Lusitaniella coriacea]MBE9116882.1 adenylyltransferase/cytidyltransferase family protein [Lusitaniella coriacea LEGE 07157]